MTLVDTYARFWNSEPDQARELAASVFTPEIQLESLVGEFTGVDQLINFRTEFSSHLPAFTYTTTGKPQHHHRWLRTGWEIRLPDNTVFAAGTDILTLDADRITHICSFLDQAPEGFHHDV